MQRTSAVLIDLDGTVFERVEDDAISLLQLYQPTKPDVMELILDLQKYMLLVAFYPIQVQAERAFRQRLMLENLNIEQLIVAPLENYDQVKLESYHILQSKYSIVSYIDEKEDSPWTQIDSIRRLHL